MGLGPPSQREEKVAPGFTAGGQESIVETPNQSGLLRPGNPGLSRIRPDSLNVLIPLQRGPAPRSGTQLRLTLHGNWTHVSLP